MPTPFTIDQLPDRVITQAGQSYLFFSGTAYLGLPQLPAFRALVAEAMQTYGTSYGSSRNGNLRLGLYERVEALLTTAVGPAANRPAAALTLSSGMLAGQLVVQWLRQPHTRFLYAPGTHPALWADARPELPAGTHAEWAAQLGAQVRALPAGQPVVILTNSIDALQSVPYTFYWLSTLPLDRPVTVVVDDSHGLGVLNDGRGIWAQLPQRPGLRLLRTGSLAKGMGLPGGVVFGDADTLAQLRQTAFFGACSPIPPAYLAAYEQAGPLYRAAYDRLLTNVGLAEKLLLPTGLFRQAPGYPVFSTDDAGLYPYLLDRGIFMYSFAYPGPADPPNNRIVISAFHTPDDIATLADALYAYAD